MDDTKLEELEKACKKDHKVRARLVAVRHDAPGMVSSNAKRSNPANPSASYPACPATERPITSKSAILVDGRTPGESPKARCRVSNISWYRDVIRN